MKHWHRVLVILLLACGLIAQPCSAEPAPHYVSPADLPPQLLPPPPQEGSEAWREQIKGVVAAEEIATSVDLTAMRDEQHLTVDLVASVIGPHFTRDRYPHTYALVENALADCEAVTNQDKQFWHTRRPYLTDSSVKIQIDRIDQSPSYPSGHTAGSRVMAETLGLVFPERLADLRRRADEIAYHRIEAGVHYPGDIEGGRMLAMLVIGGMMKTPAFQSDLAAARAETAK